MYQLTAAYDHPADPDAFLEHYRTKHVALARELPGVRSLGWTVCETPDGSPPAHFVIAVLRWDSRAEALAALDSPAGQAVVADLANFATAGVAIDLGDVLVEV